MFGRMNTVTATTSDKDLQGINVDIDQNAVELVWA